MGGYSNLSKGMKNNVKKIRKRTTIITIKIDEKFNFSTSLEVEWFVDWVVLY